MPVKVTVSESTDYLLSERADMILPCSLYLSDSELSVSVYPDFKEAVLSWLSHHDFTMSEACLSSLHTVIRPIAEGFGYQDEGYDATHRLLCFRGVKTAPTLPPPLAYDTLDGVNDLTDFCPEQADGCLCYLEDNQIVAVAGENSDLRDGKIAEIAVETAPNYRNKGYGSALVSYLTNRLLDRGDTVLYKTDFTNRASVRCAEKAGFVFYGSEYHVCCYRD